jgi:acetylornithine deacetylase/succinyl-diaminopimelate desuccinylase-like protein
MLAKVKAAVGPKVDVDVLLSGVIVNDTPANTDLFQVLANEMKKADPGSAVAATVGAGTSDSRYFRQQGVIAYGIAPFKVNYYDADTVHAADERIREKFFLEGTRLTRRIVASFCARGDE